MAFELTESGAYLGREVFVQIAFDGGRTLPADAAFEDIGGTKDLTLSGQWGTQEVVNRSTLNRVRERLADYVGFTGSCGGNILAGQDENIRATRNRAWGIVTGAPSESVTPNAWIRFVIPDEGGADAGDTEVLSLPVILNQFDLDMPDENFTTFTMNFEGRGRLQSEVVVAPTT